MSALFAWDRARAPGGRFLLRIEDIDPARCRPHFAAAIEADLAWLGLRWDHPVRRQSAHLADYAAALDRLRAEGLLYRCTCTRAAIAREVADAGHAPHAPDGAPVYPGTCRMRNRTADGPFAWRLDMAEAVARSGPLTAFEDGEGRWPCDPRPFGDIVLARKDVPASYHLCVTHDDALQGVTLVTRAVDLRPVTAIHRLLQSLLGWPEPAYAHHPLLTDAAGRRLAKRDGAAALQDLRAQGHTPEAVRIRARSGSA